MNAVTEWGLDFILSLQQGSDFWAQFFAVFTFMGDEEFYLLFLPLLVWSVDRANGMRLFFLYLLSAVLNVDLKDVFQAPRPGHLDPAVILSDYTDLTGYGMHSYGMPSGHAQLAVTVWGGLAVLAKRRWVWRISPWQTSREARLMARLRARSLKSVESLRACEKRASPSRTAIPLPHLALAVGTLRRLEAPSMMSS